MLVQKANPGSQWPPAAIRSTSGHLHARRCSSALALGLLSILPLALAACSGGSGFDSSLGVTSSPRVASSGRIPKGGGVYKVGRPYRVGGRWYHPHEDPNYDRTGVASWYGTGFHGRRTANGEVYDMYALTAGHPTLPLPSYAYVTNLQNGRTILVRVNDRGPYAKDRLIDLSYQSARTLGFHQHGLARVRVRYAGRAPLNGDDSAERRFLAQSQSGNSYAAVQTGTSAISTGSLRTPGQQPTWSVAQYRRGLTDTVSAPSALGSPPAATYLRVGTFRSRTEVERLRWMLAGPDPAAVEPVGTSEADGFRLRLGPYDDAGAASAMSRIAAAGFEPDASSESLDERGTSKR
ncbi:septal ring lytic transglycosylase RlpA family protein [Hyphomicrobium sp. NDB2Meth4]|uniref:septal ring lytic transglycosylase RlpA family protein n=1 Tax=Hyphomicrobium sp. NDB2Meth4 TaxID=1892846 RepID=UPI0009FB454E|nr:septal ring lytic transglycosylase RlpA family protein [Hyphomicrobium sp. NDB2Meth4]